MSGVLLLGSFHRVKQRSRKLDFNCLYSYANVLPPFMYEVLCRHLHRYACPETLVSGDVSPAVDVTGTTPRKNTCDSRAVKTFCTTELSILPSISCVGGLSCLYLPLTPSQGRETL